jgi:hypothetical protein
VNKPILCGDGSGRHERRTPLASVDYPIDEPSDLVLRGGDQSSGRPFVFPHVASLLLVASAALAVSAPARGFDDRDICAAAQQVAIAVENDIGVWIDRVTRQAGMVVACDKKVIEFRGFTYTPATSMTEAWQAQQVAKWKRTRCAGPIWTEAIRNDWKIVLTITSVDRRQLSLQAQCR